MHVRTAVGSIIHESLFLMYIIHVFLITSYTEKLSPTYLENIAATGKNIAWY